MGVELPHRGRWPRLLSERDAAEYLSIGTSTLRTLGLPVMRIGRLLRYDVKDLDRFADRRDEQPIASADLADAVADEERRFFEKRERQRGAN